MTAFAEALLDWHDHSGRHDLPWQRPRNPYRVWLAEIMLQQTQVRTAAPYFERFVTALPDLPALAEVDLDTVLALWSGLGYYTRARNLHRTAHLCRERHGGELPDDFDALTALPGIGRSTAGAILAQAFEKPFPILDGNVKRVLCRYHGIDGWPGERAVENTLWRLADSHLPTRRLADYTQAQMDLGATVCTRATPACARCPLHADCLAKRQNRTEQLPIARPGKPLPHRQTVMLILRNRRDEVLLERRPPTGVWAGLWSLPETENHDQARTWLRLRTREDIAPMHDLPPLEHVFSHYRLRIQPLLCSNAELADGVRDGDRQRWQALTRLDEVGLPAPVKRLLLDLSISSQDEALQ